MVRLRDWGVGGRVRETTYDATNGNRKKQTPTTGVLVHSTGSIFQGLVDMSRTTIPNAWRTCVDLFLIEYFNRLPVI